MTTKTTALSSVAERGGRPFGFCRREEWGLRARAHLAAMPGLREVVEDLRLYADLDAELDRCCPPLHLSPAPSRELRRRHGAYFDTEEVRRFLVFCRKLRHVKGKWAGRPLIPDLWQVLYVVGPVFGWRRADGNRLFVELYLEVPRKNGKSTLCSAIVLYLLMADSNLRAGRLSEAGAEVYSLASTTDQAKAVFRPAEAMARRSPSIGRRLGIKPDKALVYEKTVSRYEVLSGVPQRAEDKMGLNPSGAVIDELHTLKDRRLVDTVETGTGAREQPLLVYITTAGPDTEGTIYDEKRTFAEAVTAGEVPDSRSWAVIYTIPEQDLDHWDHLDVIAKANPGFGVSVTVEYLEEILTKARRSEEKKLAFCRLHLNVRTGQLVRWMPVDVWDRSGAQFVRFVETDLHGRVAYGGLDLASSRDLAAIALVVPSIELGDDGEPIEYLDVVLRAWTPADGIARRQPREAALFRQWADQGLLLTSSGEVIDFDDIEAEAFHLADVFELRRLHFDRWGSKQIVNHLRDGGIKVFEMGQGFASMSAPTKESERLVLERRLRHNGHPLLRYAVSGLVVAQDASGNIKPDRDKSTTRIDPFVALDMAIDAWSRDTRGSSVYDERGMEAV